VRKYGAAESYAGDKNRDDRQNHYAVVPGQFTLLAEIVVNGNALNVDITRAPIVISSDL
jgi:hypothetical protein